MDPNKNHKSRIFHTPSGLKRINAILTPESIRWLSGTTKCVDGSGTAVCEIPNFTLYSDLLSRMALVDTTADEFRRPQSISFGQAQISEMRLAEEWGLGRKKVRGLLDRMESLGLIAMSRSRVATLVSFSGVDSVDIDG